MSAGTAPFREPFGWRALFGLLAARRVVFALLLSLAGSIATVGGIAVMLGLGDGRGAAAASRFDPSPLSLAIAFGAAWGLALLWTELISDACKSPVVRLQPAIGRMLWRSALVTAFMAAAAGALLGARLEAFGPIDALLESLLDASGVTGPLRPRHPLGYLGLATLALGAGAWSAQHRRLSVPTLAIVCSLALASYAPRLVVALHDASLLNLAAVLGGLGLAALRWSPRTLVAAAGPTGKSLFGAPSRARFTTSRPPRSRPLPPELAAVGRSAFWPAAGRFELATWSPLPVTNPLVSAPTSFLLFLLVATVGELATGDASGWAGLRHVAATLVFGPEEAGGPFTFLPHVMAGTIATAALVRLQPLSRRLLYPISRAQRAKLALHSFLRHLALGILCTLALAALTTLLLVAATDFRPPARIPHLAVALTWVLALAPWIACVGPFVGALTPRSGKVGTRATLGPNQLALVLFMGLGLVGLQVSQATLWAAAVPVAAAGWLLLLRRLGAEARGDLLPA